MFNAADILLGVRPPNTASTRRLRAGQALICLLQPLQIPPLIRRWADQGLTAIGADLVPRTLTHAQPMDALTSQNQVVGYQAALTAADTFGRCLPASVPDGGTGEPTQVLVVGGGAAGRQAAATARQLGALVHISDAHARARAEIAAHIPHVDIVIATAEVSDQRPPMLVPARAVRTMRPGSVIVDTTASLLGSTVELTKPDATVMVEPGVTIIGDDNLASKTPTSASAAYATSIVALLGHLVRDRALSIDLDDPIQAEVVVAHDRSVVNDAVWHLILDEISLAGLP